MDARKNAVQPAVLISLLAIVSCAASKPLLIPGEDRTILAPSTRQMRAHIQVADCSSSPGDYTQCRGVMVVFPEPRNVQKPESRGHCIRWFSD